MVISIPTLNLMLVALEPSADGLGAALMRALKRIDGIHCNITGCGSGQMKEEGLNSLFPVETLAVMGFTDVVRVLPEAYQRAQLLTNYVRKLSVDAVIFIDGWAFSRITAKKMREQCPRVQLIKYVAPQIWASRPQRRDFVKGHFDGVLTVLPFEAQLFEEVGIRTAYSGNSVFQEAARTHIDRQHNVSEIRRKYAPATAPLLAILPGSRNRELRQMGRIFVDTVKQLRSLHPSLHFVVPAAQPIEDAVQALFQSQPNLKIVTAAEKFDALIAADLALSVSGTITTEVAISGTPQIITYRVDWLTALWARSVLRTPYASILNIMAESELIPEFLQQHCRVDSLVEALDSFLKTPHLGQTQIQRLQPILNTLDLNGENAADRAAQTIVDWVKPQQNID